MIEPATLLLRRLETTGYFAAYSLLGDGNFRPYDWEKMAGQLSRDLQDLWRFFLLESQLPEARLRQLLGEPGVAFLKEFRFCRADNGELGLGPLALVTYRGAVFFADRGATARAYYGDDTKALMSLLPERESGKCLCLYPQSSLAVLPLARHADVELVFACGPHDREVVRANLRLNHARGTPRFGASLTGQDKTVYGVIVATCPSAFEPPMVRVPRRIAGGPDGLRRLRELLATAKTRLAREGTLVATFLFFAEADSQTMQRKLRRLLDSYGLGYSLIVCGRHLMQPGVPIFNMFFGWITAQKRETADTVARKMMAYIKAKKYEAAYLVKARIFRDSRPVRRELIDYSDLYYGAWTF